MKIPYSLLLALNFKIKILSWPQMHVVFSLLCDVGQLSVIVITLSCQVRFLIMTKRRSAGRYNGCELSGRGSHLIIPWFLEIIPHFRCSRRLFTQSGELLDGVNSLDVSLQLLFGGVAWQTIRPTVTIVFGCLAC